MGKYQSLSHSKTRLHYHVVLATKYRKKPLDEKMTNDIVRKAIEQCPGAKLRAVGIEDSCDHIHIVVSLKPSHSIGSFVRRFKQLTTHLYWDEYPWHLQKHYWGKRRLWSSGYFAETLGQASEEVVLDYVKNQ